MLRHGKAALAFIWVTAFLDVLAMGVIIPVLPKLLVEMRGGDVAGAAAVSGVFGFTWAAMQFLFSPVIGALSDRYGRRPVVLLSNLGLGLDCVLMALAPDLTWLFVGRVLSGITSSSFSTASAYVSDVSTGEQRAARFGLLGAAFGLGFIIGPALGGLLGEHSPRLPFWVSAALSLCNFAYGFFVLPESLPPERRAAFTWRSAHPLAPLKLLGTTALLGLAAVAFLNQLAHESLPSVFVLYTGHRYGWTPRDEGLVLALVGVCFTIVSALVVGPVVKRAGERGALLAGLGFGAAGFAAYGLAPTGQAFLSGIPLLALWALAGPSAQALMSREVGASEQGRLQGAVNCLKGLTGMVGPLLFTQALSAGLAGRGVPVGFPFLLAAGFMLAAIVGLLLRAR